MNYRNSVVTPGGYLYNIVVLSSIPEIYGKAQPECLHDGEGLIIIYNDIILDVYGPDSEANYNRAWIKTMGFPMLDESTYGYFSFYADEPIHINHNSPYIYYDGTGGEAVTQGIIVTKIYTPQEGDVSPFQGTAITGVQSTASTNAVVGGGDYFFEGCTYLREVVMHNATYFGPHCFDGCTSLEWLDVASKATFGEDCFANGAGVIRGTISAASHSTLGEPWELTDLPQSLRDKAWKIINHDGSELSDYWQVEVGGELTVTPEPAWTTFAGHEGTFAVPGTVYALTVTGFAEGQSLAGWYYSSRTRGEHIEDTSNPKNFVFLEDAYLEPLTELPQPIGVYTVGFGVNDETMGSVICALEGKEMTSPVQVEQGTELTFTALANEGYHFSHWSDGNEHYNVWLTVWNDIEFIAYFEADEVEADEAKVVEEPKKEEPIEVEEKKEE